MDLWNWRPEGAPATTLEANVPVPKAAAPAPEEVIPKLPAPLGKHTIAVWVNGPTTTVVFLPSGGLAQSALIVVDDTVHWSARWSPHAATTLTEFGWLLHGRRLAAGFALTTWAKSSPHVRAMLSWARGLMLGSGNDTAQRGALDLRDVNARMAPCPRIGQIRYDNFQSVAKKSAHTFEALHAMMARAVGACVAAWGWEPSGLTVGFFTGRNAMGLAFAPGKGDRRIALHHDLLARYDLDSISRTVLHELCHHAREELHPRGALSGLSRNLVNTIAHDAKFCEMLALVDSTVAANPRSCRYFEDDADPEVLRATQAARGVVHAASAGVVRIGLDPAIRRYRFRWDAVGNHAWRATWEVLNDRAWRAFLALFPEGERRLLRVDYDENKKGSALASPAYMTDLEVTTGPRQIRATLGAFIEKARSFNPRLAEFLEKHL